MSVDYAALRLKARGDAVRLEEILQMECREKAASKLPALLSEYPDFLFPSLASAEMATGEEAAEIHVALAGKGNSVLDMTCGLGIDAFTMARSGKTVTACEIDAHTAEIVRQNAATLSLKDFTVVNADSVAWLENSGKHFDIIFIDPARRDTSGRHYRLTDCHPDVLTLMPLLTSHGSRVIIKASPMTNQSELAAIPHDTHIIGTRHECKEVVLVIGDGVRGETYCHTMGHGSFRYDGFTSPPIGNPAPGDFLYCPYPAIMKAGGNVNVEGITKIDRFSHLYFSPDILDFPGERRRIVDIVPFDRQSVKSFAKRYPAINVSVRNFPVKAPELAKRLKIKEGGDLILYGTTFADGRKMMIITEPNSFAK